MARLKNGRIEIYDITTDEMRVITLDDVNRLEKWVQINSRVKEAFLDLLNGAIRVFNLDKAEDFGKGQGEWERTFFSICDDLRTIVDQLPRTQYDYTRVNSIVMSKQGNLHTQDAPIEPEQAATYEPPLVVGDVVTLKSGGPHMSITQLVNGYANLSWFDDSWEPRVLQDVHVGALSRVIPQTK